MENGNYATKRLPGLSGATLKLIAIITMVIDHSAAVFLEPHLVAVGFDAHPLSHPLYPLFAILRMLIGRIAFPIFCFLLVEGALKTRNIWKHLGRLAIFALVSEIPFDWALFEAPYYPHYQNVFFTLFFGVLGIAFIEMIRKKGETAPGDTWILPVTKRIGEQFIWFLEKVLPSFGVAILCMLGAHFLHTDYGARGVFAILLFYVFARSRMWQIVSASFSYVFLLSEVGAIFAFPVIAAYNNTRGKQLKYLFYVFYPGHLLLLVGLRALLGS
ncbi:MAG: conjugal transfer protein TraX [Clostridium sp.]|jgi:hypothetical protein|nr:conjugal transfer protein TraX [Clostridium sp.]